MKQQDVALFSQYGQFLVPTDYSMNVTFHLAEDFRQADGFTQPNDDTTKTAEQGKHYVAFVVSDGDNAQYWQNTAIFSTSYMNATGRENDDFAVTWSISPSIAELMPLVMDTAYNGSITTENDYFCAPVSGQGYIDAGNFYNAGTEYMNTFLGNLDTYLKRSDLSVTTIIGAENYSGGIYGTLNAYAGVESLEGGLVLTATSTLAALIRAAYTGRTESRSLFPAIRCGAPRLPTSRRGSTCIPLRLRVTTPRTSTRIPSSTCIPGRTIMRISARSSACSMTTLKSFRWIAS